MPNGHLPTNGETQPEPAVNSVFLSANASQTASSDASEIERLKADVARLEADSAIEQDTIDSLLNQLTTAGDELAVAEKLLAEKEVECVALRSSLDELKGQNTQPQPQPLETTTAHDTMVVGLRQQIGDLVACLDERDKRIAAVESKLAEERNERLQVGVRDQQQLTVQAPQSEDADGKTVRELQQLVQFLKGNSENLAKDMRALQTENLQLVDDLGITKRDLDDEKSACVALKMQANII